MGKMLVQKDKISSFHKAVPKYRAENLALGEIISIYCQDKRKGHNCTNFVANEYKQLYKHQSISEAYLLMIYFSYL